MNSIIFFILFNTILTKFYVHPSSLDHSNLARALNNDRGKKCDKHQFCASDADCYGGKCFGVHVGRCMCQCVKNRRCSLDLHCGLLQNACDLKTGRCKCENAYKMLGFASMKDAYANFCFKKRCTKFNENVECHGMACGAGECRCR
uniref:Uncharacterized protein n=1 Tax=Meloidogyne incognita TaxID=6306 RepID=A0A914KGX1_MELIC